MEPDTRPPNVRTDPMTTEELAHKFTVYTRAILTGVALVGVLTAFTVTQVGLTTHEDLVVLEAERTLVTDSLGKRMDRLENLQRTTNSALRCLLWDVKAEKCEKALNTPLPRPGGTR